MAPRLAAADPSENDRPVTRASRPQWLGMGRALMESEPVFREKMEGCAAAFKGHTDWSLMDEVYASEETDAEPVFGIESLAVSVYP